MQNFRGALIAVGCGLLAAMACADSESSTGEGSAGSAGSGASGGSGGSSGFGGSGGLITDGGNEADVDFCAQDSFSATRKPLAVQLVVDRSASMNVATSGGTRWQAVRMGLNAFLADPDSESIELGLSLFPQALDGEPPQSCSQDADCGAYGPCQDLGSFGACFASLGSAPYSSCELSDYAPQVAYGPVPDVKAQIDTTLAVTTPSGNTPTSTALQAAIDSLRDWGVGHPQHALAVVLATDGDPTDCLPTSPAAIAQIATLGRLGAPSVSTFVVGVGVNSGALEQIARAGSDPPNGAFYADVDSQAAAGLTSALRKVRFEALGCAFEVPKAQDGKLVDTNYVNIYIDVAEESVLLPLVTTAEQCGSDEAWFYQMENSEVVGFELCPAACDRLQSGPEAKVMLAVGCETILK